MLEGARIWAVVSCMGRLSFLRQSAASVLSDPGVHYCLVDYSCPDGSGNWLREEFSTLVESGRLLVERVEGKRFFNKSAAQNRGARRVVREGAEYICFLDADTIVDAGFFAWLRQQLRPSAFLIAGRRDDGSDAPSLTGVLALHADAFEKSGGLDESFQGWGGEDIEFRIRLRLLHGLDYADIPLCLVRALEHGNDLRAQFYRQKNCGASNHVNLRKLRYRIWNTWRDRWRADIDTIERLWYRGTASR